MSWISDDCRKRVLNIVIRNQYKKWKCEVIFPWLSIRFFKYNQEFHSHYYRTQLYIVSISPSFRLSFMLIGYLAVPGILSASAKKGNTLMTRGKNRNTWFFGQDVWFSCWLQGKWRLFFLISPCCFSPQCFSSFFLKKYIIGKMVRGERKHSFKY